MTDTTTPTGADGLAELLAAAKLGFSHIDVVSHGNDWAKVRDAIDTAEKRLSALSSVADGPMVFRNTGDSEAQFIADGERLNCPACGGSGHVEDTRPAAPVGDGEAVACEFCGGRGFTDDGHVEWDGQVVSAPEGCVECDGRGTVLATRPAAAGVGEDWVLVPREPTPEMLCAAGVMNNYDVDAGGRADDDHIAWWKDMLAAAPSPGAGGEK